jgi:hypothetical protein
MFIWGSDDPYLSPQDARPSIEQIPAATLHEQPAGHGPWLVNTEHTAELIQTHLTSGESAQTHRVAARRPEVTSTLVGASSIEQLDENLAALDNLSFDSAELAEIDRYATEGDVNLWRPPAVSDS